MLDLHPLPTYLALALRMRLADFFDGFCDRASSLFIRADASGRSSR